MLFSEINFSSFQLAEIILPFTVRTLKDVAMSKVSQISVIRLRSYTRKIVKLFLELFLDLRVNFSPFQFAEIILSFIVRASKDVVLSEVSQVSVIRKRSLTRKKVKLFGSKRVSGLG